jgi:hypothetical protein
VLATGETYEEITDRVEFATGTPTLTAANVCKNTRIVQILESSVRLMNGGIIDCIE